jgi:hypothetical protein
VAVRVDEARDDGAVGRVDHLGVAGVERVPDSRDAVVFDQDVAAVQVSELPIHREDMTASEQYARGHHTSLRFGAFGSGERKRPGTLNCCRAILTTLLAEDASRIRKNLRFGARKAPQ